jgi:hypothetical protein
MERSVEVVAIILFGVTGLSHIVQPAAWAEFFILLRGKGEAGAFVDGFLNLPVAGLVAISLNLPLLKITEASPTLLNNCS